MRAFRVLTALPLAFALACGGEETDDELPLAEDAEDASIEEEMKADVAGIKDWSPESRAVLDVASGEMEHYLINQVRLSSKVAKAIYKQSHGADGYTLNPFTNLAELDKVPYTGTTVFQALLAFAKKDGRVVKAATVTNVATARQPTLEAVRTKGKTVVESDRWGSKAWSKFAKVVAPTGTMVPHLAQQLVLADWKSKGITDLDLTVQAANAATAKALVTQLTGTSSGWTTADKAFETAVVNFLKLHPDQITAFSGSMVVGKGTAAVTYRVIVLGHRIDAEYAAFALAP